MVTQSIVQPGSGSKVSNLALKIEILNQNCNHERNGGMSGMGWYLSSIFGYECKNAYFCRADDQFWRSSFKEV